MKTLTIGVSDRTDVKKRMAAAFKGKAQGGPRLSFASAELLVRVLTEPRMQLLRTMAGAGPMSLRELARRVDRDVKRVHGDAHALLNAGVLYNTDDGELEFPFSGVHVEFEIVASAA